MIINILKNLDKLKYINTYYEYKLIITHYNRSILNILFIFNFFKTIIKNKEIIKPFSIVTRILMIIIQDILLSWKIGLTNKKYNK